MADQAAAAAADKGQSNGNKFCVCEAEATFFLRVWRVKKDNERFWRLGSYKFLGFFWLFFFFFLMIFQILTYGLLISKIKDQNFLLDIFSFFLEFKLGSKKLRGQVDGEGVQIFIAE